MKHIAILLSATLLLASCGSGDEKAGDKTAELAKLKKERADLDAKITKLEVQTAGSDTSRKATPVTVTEANLGAFNAFVDVQAVVQGDQNVLATPQAPGVVTNITVRPGQKVGKGQTLATLDAAAIEQQIKSADASLILAKQLYEKQQKLWAQNIGSQVQLLQAKANYESGLAQKASVVAQRNMYRITAPISGTVDAVDIKEGDIASPGQTGIRVVNSSDLKVTANLGESNLGKVKEGDPVKLVFGEGDTLRTKLSYVSKSVTPLSRTFQVEVRLGNNAKLSPNMSCRMLIENYTRSSAFSVPVSVVQKTGKGDMLYIAQGNKAKEVYVQTGKVYNGNVEILSGLNPGDKVITEGYQDLDNEELITISQ